MNEELIRRFYAAFRQGDFRTMQSCYHPEATFYDPVFRELNGREVRMMWQMLLTSAKDLKVEFNQVKANADRGGCRWDAWYTFSRTGKQVHNIIFAAMEFKDGKIFRHVDTFDFWRWSRQALGVSGVLLGWSPIVKNKVRSTARRGLEKFMKENP